MKDRNQLANPRRKLQKKITSLLQTFLRDFKAREGFPQMTAEEPN